MGKQKQENVKWMYENALGSNRTWTFEPQFMLKVHWNWIKQVLALDKKTNGEHEISLIMVKIRADAKIVNEWMQDADLIDLLLVKVKKKDDRKIKECKNKETKEIRKTRSFKQSFITWKRFMKRFEAMHKSLLNISKIMCTHCRGKRDNIVPHDHSNWIRSSFAVSCVMNETASILNVNKVMKKMKKEGWHKSMVKLKQHIEHVVKVVKTSNEFKSLASIKHVLCHHFFNAVGKQQREKQQKDPTYFRAINWMEGACSTETSKDFWFRFFYTFH